MNRFEQIYNSIAPRRDNSVARNVREIRRIPYPALEDRLERHWNFRRSAFSTALEGYISNLPPAASMPRKSISSSGDLLAAEALVQMELVRLSQCSVTELNSMRRRLARTFHPDKNARYGSGLMMLINERIDSELSGRTRQ